MPLAEGATVHSFVPQVEHLGEAAVCTALAVLASGTSISVVTTASAVLFTAAGLVVVRSGRVVLLDLRS